VVKLKRDVAKRMPEKMAMETGRFAVTPLARVWTAILPDRAKPAGA
jgi:hypothetical protein